jgi:hypothetical protein
MWVCFTSGPVFYQEAWLHVSLSDIRASLLPGSLAAFRFVLHQGQPFRKPGCMWVCLTLRPAFYLEAWQHLGLFHISASLLPGSLAAFGLFDIRASLLPGSLAACGVVCYWGQAFTWEPGGFWVCLTLGPAFYLGARQHLGLCAIRASLLPGSLAACVRTARQATRWQQLHLLLIVLLKKLYSEIDLSNKRPSHNPLFINQLILFFNCLANVKDVKGVKTFTVTLR